MKFKRKKGFTLIEMVATLAIFTIVIVMITSLIVTLFKYNSINKKTFDSNSMSKVFFETVRGNRPSDVLTYPGNNTYYIAFNNEEELVSSIKDKLLIDSISDGGGFILGRCLSTDDFNSLKNKSGVQGKSYLIKVSVNKNLREKVYEFNTESWHIPKGEVSIVSRKNLISSEI